MTLSGLAAELALKVVGFDAIALGVIIFFIVALWFVQNNIGFVATGMLSVVFVYVMLMMFGGPFYNVWVLAVMVAGALIGLAVLHYSRK